jgi:hypothetical protein
MSSASVVDSHNDHHQCYRREDDRTLGDQLWAWYLLPLHIVSALVFTAIMVFVVNDRDYPVCNDGDPGWRSLLRCGLTQSDVTSLISVALDPHTPNHFSMVHNISLERNLRPP